MSGKNLLEAIDSFMKQAAVKAAEGSSTEGVIQNQGDSGTSHPSKSVDDGTQPAPEGSRSAENTSDVKSQVPGQPVDEAKEDKMDGASESPLTTAKPTGEDPSNETSSASPLIGGDAGKDIEGKDTEHPAKVDFGGKYASVQDLLNRGQTKQAAMSLIARLNDFNARLAALRPKTAAAPATPPIKAAPKAKAKLPTAEAEEPKQAAANADEEAGKTAAKIAAAQLGITTDTEKQAQVVESLVKEALEDGNRYLDFLAGMITASREQQTQKVARARKRAVAAIKRAALGAPPPQEAPPMPPAEAGSDELAFGGDSEGAEGGAPGESQGHEQGEIEQILAELEAAGVDPEVLQNIDPADLAEALATAEGEGGEGGEGGEAMPEGGMPEQQPQPMAV